MFVISLFSAHCGNFGFNSYEIVSYVENVRYSNNEQMPCEIALFNGIEKIGLPPHTYHGSKNVKLCKFAERCKLNRLQVKVTGRLMKIFRNFAEVYQIEYAH